MYAEGSAFRYMVAGTDGRLYYHSDADTDPRNPIDEVNWVVEPAELTKPNKEEPPPTLLRAGELFNSLWLSSSG